jgi:hypothetical protein
MVKPQAGDHRAISHLRSPCSVVIPSAVLK